MAGKSCHILRPAPIEHEYDPRHLQGRAVCDQLRGICRRHGPTRSRPSPSRGKSSRGTSTPGARPGLSADGRPAGRCVQKPAPGTTPWARGFTPHFNLLKFVALAGGAFPLPARVGTAPRLCLLPAAGQFCPAHLRLCGQGPRDPRGSRAHGRAHTALLAVKRGNRRGTAVPNAPVSPLWNPLRQNPAQNRALVAGLLAHNFVLDFPVCVHAVGACPAGAGRIGNTPLFICTL